MTIPLPPDAAGVFEWNINSDETVTRWFHGPDHRSGDATLCIYGEQDHSGRVLHRTGHICVGGGGYAEMDTEQLRELAANALAIAREL